MRIRKRCGVLGVILLLAGLAVPAAAQLRTGNLYFKTFDRDRQPLSGVTVTLLGPEAPAVRITDERGEARFLSLLPGEDYYLRAERDEDILPMEYFDIAVHAGRNTQVSMELLPDVVDNNWVFSGASPLIDRRNVGTITTISNWQIERLPGSFDLWTLLASTSGVLVGRVAWSLEGIEISSSATGRFPGALDPASFEEIHVSTGGSNAAVATSGVSINLVTQHATNEWRGSARYLTLDNVIDRGLQAGGPLKRDRLWIWGSYAKPEVRQRTQERTQEIAALALDGNITDDNSFKAFAWDSSGRAEGLGQPAAWKIEDTQMFLSGSYLTGFYGRVEGDQIRAEGASVFDAGPAQHDLRYGAAFRSVRSGSDSESSSAYVQDVLPLGPLTASAGLRWDRQDSTLGGSTVSWSTFVPRLGLTWAPGEDDRTLLSAGYSVFADRLGAVAADDLDAPRTAEALLGVQRRLEPTGNMVLGLQLTWRRNGERDQDFRGAILSASRPFARQWSLSGFLSLQDRAGFVDRADALIQSRWSYGLNGLYRVAADRPWGFDVAANLTGRQGYPVEPLAGDPAREPDVHLLDLGFQRELYVHDFGLRLGLDVLNVLNRSTVLRREVPERMRPRAYGFNLRFSYR